MSIKTILVVVSGEVGYLSRLDMAFALATKYKSTVITLYIREPSFVYIDGHSKNLNSSIIEIQENQIESHSIQVKSETVSRAAKSQIPIEWRYDDGDETTIAILHARYCDLIISSPHSAKNFLFNAGVPLIVVPAGSVCVVPHNMLIAWNGSREAAIAIHNAIPLLNDAKSVTALYFDAPNNFKSNANFTAHFAGHGIDVELKMLLSNGQSIGSLIIKEAVLNMDDMIVMGGYGHSRFNEWILGSVTEEMIYNSPIPLFVSH